MIDVERLLTPAITNQENYYRKLGLRERILNLPLMMAAVLTLLWRDVAGVRELTRMLARDGFLWCNPTQVSQQALSQRFLTFPYSLFEKVFFDLLPSLRTAWHSRNKRTLPESIQFTLSKFEKIWIVDGESSAVGGFPAVGNWRTRRAQHWRHCLGNYKA
ncbi:Transposase [Nostoc sphaeroides CCNUC1]|uniref:Transposase n=1 Tax=Nostoc sphaeroides CCNUC1 TaxID=2653204 RepID=A0A5P8WIN0_9NOSO|nr:Transposase [Nostoc sphaeroides CCNUC1]